MNPKQLFSLKNRWPLIKSEHSDLLQYFKNNGENLMQEGTRVQMLFTMPDGTQSQCEVTLNKDDMETYRMVRDMFKK